MAAFGRRAGGSLGFAAFVVAAATRSARSQPRVYRVAILSGGSVDIWLTVFREAMGGFGYEEGRNLALTARGADGRFERLPALARELIAREPDVLLVSTTPAVLAAKKATATIPIVMIAVGDPVGLGMVASLARPGGNITGITNLTAELAGKRLELLHELMPTARRVAVLINTNDPVSAPQLASAERVAAAHGIHLDPVLTVRDSAELERAIPAAAGSGADAALRMVDPLVNSFRARTVELAAAHRLPIVYAFREDAEAGGLAAYGASQAQQYRQAAGFVHRILQGAKPAEIPVEQPTTFELVLNLASARALGITIPPAVLARADEVIE